MAIRAAARFGFLRYDPGNPQFPALPDGVIIGHPVKVGHDGGGSKVHEGVVKGTVFASAPGPDVQRYGGWLTETTWINPTVIDFGVIPSPVRRTVNLYNARSITVDVTALNLPTGMTLISPALPQTLEKFDGIEFTLEAELTGPASFDEFVEFTTDEGPVSFRILGRRIFTLNVSPQRPLVETLSFNTDLLRSSDATEKAYGLLQSPTSTIDYEVLFSDDLERIRFKNNFIAGESALVVSGQKWHEVRPLDADAAAVDTVLQVDTSHASFAVDKPVSVITTAGEALSGQIDSLDGSSITLSAPLGSEALAGSRVMPVGLGYVSKFPKYGTYAVNAEGVRYSLSFNQEPAVGALDGSYPLLNAFPILEFCNELSGRTKKSDLIRSELTLDSGLSNRIAFNEYPFADEVSDFKITLKTRADIWMWRQFIEYLRGSYLEFYVPTFRNDIPSVTTAASNVFDADDTDLSLLFGSPPAERRSALRFLFPDGTIEYRTITDIVDNVATEQITVNAAVTAGNPVISFMQLSRILADTATFVFERPEQATLTFKYRTINT